MAFSNPKQQTSDSTQHRPSGSAGGQHTVHDPLPEFLVIRSVETDEAGQAIPLKLNPFQRHQAISKFGDAKQVLQRADGTLEVQLTRENDIRKLLSAKELSFKAHGLGIRTIPVKVEPHPTKNTVKGVITCQDLRGVSEDEIVEGMEEQGVLAARRIRRRERGAERALVDTDSVILTFNRTNLPDRVKVGYLSVRVRLYIPDPVRCYKCQAFGHVSQRCREQQRCACCSESDHEAKDCKSATFKCANCGGPHKASDRKCETFLAEQEVKALMVRERLPFRQAQAQVRARRPAVSYRDAAARQPPPPPPRPPPRARGEDTRCFSLDTDMNTLLRDMGDLRSMSVGHFLHLVSQLVPSGSKDKSRSSTDPGAPTQSREPGTFAGPGQPSVSVGPLIQTSETSQETVLATPVVASPVAAVALTSDAAEVLEDRTLVPSQRTTDSTRVAKPKAKSPPVPPRPASKPNRKSVPDSSASPTVPRSSEKQSVAGPTPAVPPPLPPPPPRGHGPRAPTPPSASVPLHRLPLATPPSGPRQMGPPSAPGNPAKRTLPSPSDGESPRGRHKPGSTGRSSSVDARLRLGHPRVVFGDDPPPGGEHL